MEVPEKRVLLVEDHELIRLGTGLLLESLGEVRCEIKPCRSLDEARAACRDDGPFDLVLLDLNLIDSKGLQGRSPNDDFRAVSQARRNLSLRSGRRARSAPPANPRVDPGGMQQPGNQHDDKPLARDGQELRVSHLAGARCRVTLAPDQPLPLSARVVGMPTR